MQASDRAQLAPFLTSCLLETGMACCPDAPREAWALPGALLWCISGVNSHGMVGTWAE